MEMSPEKQEMLRKLLENQAVEQQLMEILKAIRGVGGRCLLVGGCVRDDLLGIAPKDYDTEVYGLTYRQLTTVLAQFGKPNLVGASFGVIKVSVNGQEFDFSLPRTESKVGIKHTDFTVDFSPDLTPVQACARRDFTINAIAYDPFAGEYIDPFNGREDLEAGLLRPTSSAFAEDALRVLRGMQFAGRFMLKSVISSELTVMYTKLRKEYDALPKERIWGEWSKWAEKSVIPSLGLNFLQFADWLVLYPQLYNLFSCPQDPIWHPEGSAGIHTLHVCDAMARICDRDGIVGEERIVRMMAALCHDIGKPATTEHCEDGRIRSQKHCEVGSEMAKPFLESIGCFPRIIDQVVPLVAEHLVHIRFPSTPRTVRRLAMRLNAANVNQLASLVEADQSGRPPLPGGLPDEMKGILKLAATLKVTIEKPKAILNGDMLMAEFGYKQGRELGQVLKAAFQAQLDGEFENVEQGIQWVRNGQVPTA